MELQKIQTSTDASATLTSRQPETGVADTYLKRYEQKYLLNKEQYRTVTDFLDGRFSPDIYGKSVIYSVYYDTDDYSIIRKAFTAGSAYREKIRLRSYGSPERASDTVYVELKKKFRGSTYKRRFAVPFGSLLDSSSRVTDAPPLPNEASAKDSSLYKEFAWFYQRYDLSPKFLVVYNRLALEDKNDPFIRITFDTNIRCRRGGFFVSNSDCTGWKPLTNQYLMEIKTVNVIPLSISRFLSAAGVFPVSFSKLRTAYRVAS